MQNSLTKLKPDLGRLLCCHHVRKWIGPILLLPRTTRGIGVVDQKTILLVYS